MGWKLGDWRFGFHHCTNFFQSSPEAVFIDFRERARERDTDLWPLVRTPPGHRTCNFFGIWDDVPTTWATQAGPDLYNSFLTIGSSFNFLGLKVSYYL